MKHLLIMRHAKSSWKNAALSDHDRPLNERGERDAPQMGGLLQEIDHVPSVIVTSTALRAATTAEHVANALGSQPDLIQDRRLFHASLNDFNSVVAELDEQHSTALIISHNPGIEQFVFAISNRTVQMPTAAIATLEFPQIPWSDFVRTPSGALIDVWRPKEVLEYYIN